MVKDIRTLDADSFSDSDAFFLDTNVMLYLHHPPSTQSNQRKAEIYSNFIAKLRNLGCSLHVSSFNVQEAFHVVEDIAFKGHNKMLENEGKKDMPKKRFRKEYRNQIGKLQASLWKQLRENYIIETASANREMLEAFVEDYTQHLYDPIDYLFTLNYPTCNIITADRDFSNDSTINVYTY